MVNKRLNLITWHSVLGGNVSFEDQIYAVLPSNEKKKKSTKNFRLRF